VEAHSHSSLFALAVVRWRCAGSHFLACGLHLKRKGERDVCVLVVSGAAQATAPRGRG
jgi:hypothetical protein